MRAAVIGSPGYAKGSLSMITQLNASPTTSTPCQKLDVAKRTAFGVDLNSRSSAERGALPWITAGQGVRAARHWVGGARGGDVVYLPQVVVAGEQHERPPVGAAQDLDALARRRLDELRRA